MPYDTTMPRAAISGRCSIERPAPAPDGFVKMFSGRRGPLNIGLLTQLSSAAGNRKRAPSRQFVDVGAADARGSLQWLFARLAGAVSERAGDQLRRLTPSERTSRIVTAARPEAPAARARDVLHGRRRWHLRAAKADGDETSGRVSNDGVAASTNGQVDVDRQADTRTPVAWRRAWIAPGIVRETKPAAVSKHTREDDLAPGARPPWINAD